MENANTAAWRRVMDVDLFAALHTCAAATGPMRAHIGAQGAMAAADVADATVFVASLPPRATVSERLIRPRIDTAPL